jgi:hypothetical protein
MPIPGPTPVSDYNASESASASGAGATWYDLSPSAKNFDMYNPSFTTATVSTPGYFSFPSRNYNDALTVYGEYNGTPAITASSPFTGYFWVRRNADHGSYNQNRVSIFANGREDNVSLYNGWSYGAYNNPSAANDNVVLEASSIGVSDSGQAISDAVWVCIAYVYTSTSLDFYINGAFVDNNTFSTPVTPGDGMWISRTAGSLFSWMGDISIARQYSTALSAGQILTLYNYDASTYINPTPAGYTGLVGGRQFNQGFNG